MIRHLRITPDQFEICWNSGLFSLWHLRAIKEALDVEQSAVTNPEANISPSSDINTMIDSDLLQQQFELGEL
jgi:hypothetical protein